MAWFVVELTDGVPWGFGAVKFEDIVIVAQTNETDWYIR
jgi:hypothetical protein